MTDIPSPPVFIERLMHTGLLTCASDTPLREAVERMALRRFSAIVVVENDVAIGIWTERDSLRLDLTRADCLDVPIGQVMSRPVRSLPVHASVSEAEQWFTRHRCRHLLVVDGHGRPVGMVSQADMALKQGLEPYLSLHPVSKAMDTAPLELPGHMPLAQAATELLHHNRDAAVVSCSPDRLVRGEQ